MRIGDFLRRLGFTWALSDTSLFVLRRGSDMAYLLLYVDDIVLTTSSTNFLRMIITSLSTEFKMKNLGPLHFFLGVFVVARPLVSFFLKRDMLRRFLIALLCPIASLPLRLLILSPRFWLPPVNL